MFKPRQLKRKKLLLIIVAVILLVLAVGYFGYKILTENKLTRFDIEAQNLNCTNSSEITGFLQGKNLNYFYFKSSDIDTELRKKFLCIGRIESEASYPDKLKLKIAGKEGKFIVTSIDPPIETNPTIELSMDQLNATQSTTEAFPPKVLSQILDTYKQASDSAFYLVDEEGVIFEEISSDFSRPKLSIFSQELKVGQVVPGDIIKKTSQVLEKLKETEIPTDNLIIVADKLIIDSKPRVTFSLSRPLDRQAASLQLILRQAKMNLDPDSRDTRSVESIDLRFDRPVVVYSKK